MRSIFSGNFFRGPLIRHALSALTLLLMLLSPLSSAYPLAIYNYTGINYTTVSGPYTNSMNITGSFTLENPLAANAPLTNIESLIQSFSFTDGIYTWTSSDPSSFTDIVFEVATDAGGNLSEWFIGLADSFPSPASFGDLQHELAITSLGDTALIRTCISPNSKGCSSISESADSGTTNTWTAGGALPEPASLYLLATGLTGLVVLRKRFLRIS